MARYRGKGQQAQNQQGPREGGHRGDKKKRKGSEDDLSSSNGVAAAEATAAKRAGAGRKGLKGGAKGSGEGGFGAKKALSSMGLVAIVLIVAYYGYQGYLETRISTPFSTEKVVTKTGLQVPERFWGSYRSGVYFGMKHRSPKSLLTGLMWLLPTLVKPGEPNLRHLCDQGDNLKQYGWIEHDGVNFGVQEILDHQMKLTTSFVKVNMEDGNGGEWSARITVEPKIKNTDIPQSEKRDEIVLVHYIALEPGMEGSLHPMLRGDIVEGVEGYTEELGQFRIRFVNSKGVLKTSYMLTSLESMNSASHAVLSSMATGTFNNRWMFYLKSKPDANPYQQNFLAYQVHAKGPFTLEIVYESGGQRSQLEGVQYTAILERLRKQFSQKFELTFNLEKKGFNESYVHFAKAALSNMIGGISYFHGNSKVQSPYNPVPVPYWSANLYTAVPSRSFFPRGFLWDEGFHLLLINKWSPEIGVDIISHWLDLMNSEGWIPREQILGSEALARVPDEFVVQRNNVANPPTLIMALYDLLQNNREWLLQHRKSTLQRMWPRLSAWYGWLNRTQAGETPFTFRWRGRNETTVRELNPKTLASGFDDYPRASHPNNQERHLDLRCWMALSSKLMQELAELLEFDSSRYAYAYEKLSDQELLDKLHWSSSLGAYTDFGVHSDKVFLDYPNVQRRQGQPLPEKQRVTRAAPQLGFVNTFGYVSLFPLILEVLDPNSPTFASTLSKLEDPKYLWTPYGLRSLAANSPIYNKRNTEHDPPYWRGAVWININYLTLKSLHHYSKKDSVGSRSAKETYLKLRENVINNVISQYYKTGYVWEQYDDSTGKGKGCRPFTGWSALVVLIMAEEY